MKTNRVRFIIGLPGSGKTTLRFLIQGDNDIIFEDWMRWDIWMRGVPPTKDFNEDDRYERLLESIRNGHDIIMTSIRFCEHDFLCKAEYYIKSNFPNIIIEKYYFENNPESAINNVMYRDHKQGGHWKVVEDGRKIYFGDHYGGMRCYDIGIENAKVYSKNYIIPDKYKPIPIKVQKIEK